MFRFKFVIDYFQKSGSSGPTLEANIRAKWLSILSPYDLEIAFAPYAGQTPMYQPELVKLVSQDEKGWWNHFFFNSWLTDSLRDTGWSMGPNIDLKKRIPPSIPLVAYSQYHKKNILKKWDGLPNSITVIPNMIDPDMFSPGERSKEITVGWIGYDHPSRYTKGVEVIPYLARKFPDVKFEMIHSKKPKYTNEWLKYDLPNLIIRYGIPHIEMPNVIRRWHILVCGSKWENCPNHILEAMACGVPVIAALVGAIPEIARSQILLEDMRWSHPPYVDYPYDWTNESMERFAGALEKLLSDQKLYRSLSKAALDEVREKANPHVIANKWFLFMYMCRDWYYNQGQ